MSAIFRVPDGPAAEPVIPFPRSDADVARVSAHELRRLIENDRLLQYVLTHCTYFEDGLKAGSSKEHYWMPIDECRTERDGESMPLRVYLEARVNNEPIWTAPPPPIDYGPDIEEREPRQLQPMFWGSPV